MQHKRRIPIDKLIKLSKKDLTIYEKGVVTSIIRAQQHYPQITPRMYSAFWKIYNRYFLDVGEDNAIEIGN